MLFSNLPMNVHTSPVNSLVPGRCGCNFKYVISEHVLRINLMSTSYEIAAVNAAQHIG